MKMLSPRRLSIVVAAALTGSLLVIAGPAAVR